MRFFRSSSRLQRLGILLVSAIVCLSSPTAIVAQVADKPDEVDSRPREMFERDQPCIDQILWWDGRIVVHAGGFYEIDVKGLRVKPFSLPGVKEVVSLSSSARGRNVALCEGDKGPSLFESENGKLQELAMPKDFGTKAEGYIVAVDEKSACLASNVVSYLLDDGKWSKRELPDMDLRTKIRFNLHRGPDWPPDHYVLSGDHLFIGYDNGEWGGGFCSIDVRKGEIDYEAKGQGDQIRHTPVSSFRKDKQGRLWAVVAVKHMVHDGTLAVRDEMGWRIFAANSEYGPADERAQDWNLPPANYADVAFDSEDRPYLLTDQLGVVRFDKGKWTHLTRSWKCYVGCFGLLLAPDNKAVIATNDAGVVIWDLETQDVKRIVFPRAADTKGDCTSQK